MAGGTGVVLPSPMPVTMAMPPASHNTMSRELVMVFPVPTQSHSVRASEYQPPISVTERATAALVGRPCIGPLAGLPSFRARPSPSPLSLQSPLGRREGRWASLLSPSLSFPSPIYLLAPHPNPQIDVTSRSFSVDRPNLLFRG